MRNGIFNVGAEALEDYDVDTRALDEWRAVLLVGPSASAGRTPSRRRRLSARVRAVLQRLVACFKRIKLWSNAAADCESAWPGDAIPRRARSRARPRRRARRWRRANH